MVFREVGMVREVKEEKAKLPITVTVVGIKIEVMFKH